MFNQKQTEQKINREKVALSGAQFSIERQKFPEAANVDHTRNTEAVKAFEKLDTKADLNGLQGSVFKTRGAVCNNRLMDARMAEEGQIHNFQIKWGNNGFGLDQIQMALQRFENKVTANGTNLKAKIQSYIQNLVSNLTLRSGSQRFLDSSVHSASERANAQARRNDPKILQRNLYRKADLVFRAFVKGSGGAADQRIMRTLLSIQNDQLEQFRKIYSAQSGRDLDEDLREFLSLKSFRRVDKAFRSSKNLQRARSAGQRRAEKTAKKIRLHVRRY